MCIRDRFAGATRFDANSLDDLFGRVVGGAEQRRQPGEQRLDVRPEHAACIEVDQQVLHLSLIHI